MISTALFALGRFFFENLIHGGKSTAVHGISPTKAVVHFAGDVFPFFEAEVAEFQEVHHILPISQGGTHDRSNLMSLCQSCHTKIHHDIGDR